MKLVITEKQNKRLKRYNLIKELVDTFDFPGLIKTEFELDWDDRFGFYKIYPTFHMDYLKMGVRARLHLDGVNTVLRNELCQRIEDYLGIHIVSPKAELKVINN
jgi:hypothetical protein